MLKRKCGPGGEERSESRAITKSRMNLCGSMCGWEDVGIHTDTDKTRHRHADAQTQSQSQTQTQTQSQTQTQTQSQTQSHTNTHSLNDALNSAPHLWLCRAEYPRTNTALQKHCDRGQR